MPINTHKLIVYITTTTNCARFVLQISRDQANKMEKRPAESENGDSNGAEKGAKKAKLDPECGRLLFCGNTDWEFVSI